MKKHKPCDNWLAKSKGVRQLMISENSLYSNTNNVMCDILKAKMISVIFRQQKSNVWYECVKILIWVDSTIYFPNIIPPKLLVFYYLWSIRNTTQDAVLEPSCTNSVGWHSESLCAPSCSQLAASNIQWNEDNNDTYLHWLDTSTNIKRTD